MIFNSYMEDEKLYVETIKSIEQLRKQELISNEESSLVESCLRNMCIVFCNSDLGILPGFQDITTASLIRIALKKIFNEEDT